MGNSVAKKGITVNAVAPALIEGTSMMAGAEQVGEAKKRMVASKYCLVELMTASLLLRLAR